MRALQAFFAKTGGPEVIEWRVVDVPAPGPGEVLLRQEAVGLNYIDTYFRSGLYPTELPSGLGAEAAGQIEAVGEGVTAFKPGDRAAYAGATGAYADARIMPAAMLFALPQGIDSRTGAAALLKGSTTEFLAERCAPVGAGEWALVPAAAGGVGLLLVQWLKARGVRVIAIVGSEEKRAHANQAGAELTLLMDEADLVGKIRAATGAEGVAVSYDGVGAATWDLSLKSLRRRGILVSFGNASGPVTGVNIGVLASHGSLHLTRPTMFDYSREPAERAAGAAKLWEMIGTGKVRVTVGQTYPLRDAAQAHRDLEARKTTGSTLLMP